MLSLTEITILMEHRFKLKCSKTDLKYHPPEAFIGEKNLERHMI